MLYEILKESWNILLVSAPYILFGLVSASILKFLIPDSLIKKHMGTGKKAVIKAAIIGIPLPICSCGVLPTAEGLKKQGAGKGAVTSFLISTPETGVDSIAVSYSLLGGFITVVRVVAAFITAAVAGLLVGAYSESKQEKLIEMDAAEGCSSGCCSSSEKTHNHHHGKSSMFDSIKHAFVDIVGDIGVWFIIGVFIGGIITAVIPDSFFNNNFGQGIGGILLMLLLSVPLYVCATSSTPIAAALILKGVSPGAAIVLLLAGPATNAAGLAVVSKILGKKETLIYLFSIITVTVIIGLGVDYFYAGGKGFNPLEIITAEEHTGIFSMLSAMFLLAVIAYNYLIKKLNSKGGTCSCG